jgi:hypothetical protein
MPPTRLDILFIMTDQQRFDTIAALGNSHIYTPNLDRPVRWRPAFPMYTLPVRFASRRATRSTQDVNRSPRLIDHAYYDSVTLPSQVKSLPSYLQ